MRTSNFNLCEKLTLFYFDFSSKKNCDVNFNFDNVNEFLGQDLGQNLMILASLGNSVHPIRLNRQIKSIKANGKPISCILHSILAIICHGKKLNFWWVFMVNITRKCE